MRKRILACPSDLTGNTLSTSAHPVGNQCQPRKAGLNRRSRAATTRLSTYRSVTTLTWANDGGWRCAVTSAGSVAELVERLGVWLCTLIGIAAVVAALAVFMVRAAGRRSSN